MRKVSILHRGHRDLRIDRESHEMHAESAHGSDKIVVGSADDVESELPVRVGQVYEDGHCCQDFSRLRSNQNRCCKKARYSNDEVREIHFER